ncbi:putative phosphodiesterase [Paenibacillus forsythiae]|uniref:Phosphodiesterase n=1 Tax=Paenibacillus forsythiae TaxID=365616 RepID=A0ABU3H4S3_9BACL|nr:S-layer homology domain-containing protein [Paenibacillus forsythiae]MDT3425813.1 putative phosphodiesterase [Paenibacillus forsythiae]
MRLLKCFTVMLLAFLVAAGSLNAAGPVWAAESSDAAVSVSKVTVTFNGDPKTSKGFTWYTPQASQNSNVQVIEATYGKAEFDTGLTFKGRTQVSTNSPLENVHKVEATGLKADTAYYFRVGDAALNVWSEAGTFRTAPASGAFTFIDLADTQAKTEDEAILSSETLAKALATVPNADFVVHNGDIVDNGIKEEQWNWLLGHSQQSLLNTTIVPSAGNHEDENYAFIEHFDVKPAAGSATETGAYYFYDYSNAHFVVLNTNENSEEYADFSKDQVEWLKSDVKAAKAAGAQWIIVNIHKGPYTTSNHATDSDIIGPNGVRNKIAPLMAELDIDFVLQGHDHIYARTKPIKSDNTAAAGTKITETVNGQSVEYTVNQDGTIYLIPATAGPKVYYKNQKPALGDKYYSLFERAEENHAAKYGPDPSDATRPKRSQVQNFIGITIDGGKLTAFTYEIDQNLNNGAPYLIDRFGIQKVAATDTGSNNNNGGNTGGNNGGNTGGTNNGGAVTTPTIPAAPTTPAPTAPVATLKDINGHWAASAINKAVELGFAKGYVDGTFHPNQKVNRAEFITLLMRAVKLPDTGKALGFKDAGKIPAWSQAFIAQALDAGIIAGYNDSTFRPDQVITRAEMAALIVRAGGVQVNPEAALSFADAKDAPKWAVPYIAAIADAGLVNGIGQNRFAPNQSVTRAEAVAIILGLLQQRAG